MPFVNEVFGALCVLGAMGAYHWITVVNAGVASYAERVWPWVGLCFIALAIICGFLGFEDLEGKYAALFFIAGSTSLGLAFISYLAWTSALDEESD